MRTLIDGTATRALLTGALLVFGSQCGAAPPSAIETDDVGSLETSLVTPVALFHPTSSSSNASGMAFDRSRFVPQGYDAAPAGTTTYGVFFAGTSGVTEWFATPSGAHAATTGGQALRALGIELSASLGRADGSDAIIGVAAPTSGASGAVVQVYSVGFPSDLLAPSDVAPLGGALPLPLGASAWPSVVGVSNGYARLIIAGEGQCCATGASCGGSGEPAYENYIYDYAPNGPATSGPSATGLDGWDYVLDASRKAPACALGLAVDNSVNGENLPGEVTFVLYADGSVQPWLTHTTVWAPRTTWKVPGAVSVAAYDGRVVILDDEGNLFSADPYRGEAPKLVVAAGANGECGGKVRSMAFDATDPAPSEADRGGRGGSLILEMQDTTAGDVPVVCSLAPTSTR